MMTHYRLNLLILLVVYVAQCSVLLATLLVPEVIVAEILIGAVVVRLCYSLFERVITHDDSIDISGFFIGGQKATITATDLIAFRYSTFRFSSWGSFAFQVAVFELRAQSAPYDYRIARFGWNKNRQLFCTFAAMVAASPITLDAKSQRALNAAAGLQNDAQEIV